MIQRIQTIYLLIAIAICALMFVLPIYIGTVQNNLIPPQTQSIEFLQNSVIMVPQTVNPSAKTEFAAVALNVVDIVMLLLTVLALVMFKNRKLQLRLTRYLILIGIIYLLVIVFGISAVKGMFQNPQDSFKLGASVPFLLPILFFLASLGIAKDIRIVKSADRLR